MKTIYQLIMPLLIACPLFTKSQVSYRFEQTTGAYADLSGHTVIQNPNFGSGDLFLVDLTGETFRFYKTPFTFGGTTTFYLQTNGNIRVDDGSSTIIVDGAFIFLDSIDNNSEISYKVEGASGNKIVKVQWKNLKIRTGQPDNFINIQIWVYQATGIIEIHYGPSSASNASGFTETGNTAGINVGIFHVPTDFSKFYEKLWLNNEPSNLVIDSSTQFAFKALKGVPPNGSVYRFVPKFSLVSSPEIKGGKLVAMYPNPAANEVNFTAHQSGIITDITGKTVMAFTEAEAINVSGLSPGTYLLKTHDGGVARLVKNPE